MFQGTNKYFIYALGGVIVLGLFIARKNDGGDVIYKGYDTRAMNDTIFIPTSETNIEYVAGNQTISNSDNRSNSSTIVGDGSTVNIPKEVSVPSTPSTPTTPTTDKFITLTKESSIFQNLNSTYASGNVAPQRVKVLQQNPSGWALVETWLGNMWVKDGYTRPTAPSTKTHTVQKGDTLWGLLGGDKNKINQAVSLNGLSNADTIYAGANIKLPV